MTYSWLTIIKGILMAKKLANVHPGEILLEEFLQPLALSQNAIAQAIGVPPRRINEICLGKRAITPDTALRLAQFFSTSPQFWLGIQNDYDLEEAQKRTTYRSIPTYLLTKGDARPHI